MPLQAFSFPVHETRCFKAGSFIYKFRIRGGSSYSGEEVMGGSCFNQELEEIIRTVLGNLDALQPFSSTHFIVFPYKKRWEGASKVMCRNGERRLRVYPFVLILYLEKNVLNEKQAEKTLSPEKEVAQRFPSVCEPESKRCKRHSPLEEAIVKALINDLEAESEVSVDGLHVDNPRAGREVKEGPGHADKKGTKRFEEPQQTSGVSTGSGTSGEVHSGTTQDMGEEEGDEEGDNAESVSGTPVEPGILTRLASHIFPLSLFFRDT
ncbi:membrane-anchored junction protein [Micropterus dolomieu]|uniref:membrane-anchored junction protein n=1 Tax=Micropterus dolomieu TaxID=147949 RepID=UPI001E8E9E8E|nr:membrane-anchored junction protein [Micropterus dolomieu]